VKRFLIIGALGLLPAVACDDAAPPAAGAGTGGAASTLPPGVCNPSLCPKPMTGIPCCTPDADCGMDPTGAGFTCLPNPSSPSTRECKRVPADGGDKIFAGGTECKPQIIGSACCTALGGCGWDPFGSGLICFANPPKINPLCDVTKCPPVADGGPPACCLPNGKCGVDTLNIGICFPPPPPAPAPTCDISTCPEVNDGGLKSCCLPNGQCGTDTLGIGVCFLPPLPPVTYTQVPNDPSITGECPSYIGLFGPLWGCCARVGKFGVCGQFQGNSCFLNPGSQIPTGPAPAADSGKVENFLRCTPPPVKSDAGP